MDTNRTISWTEIVALLSPEGQQRLVDWIRNAKEERGSGWLDAVRAEYPTFCWMIDLVANKTADEAFRDLQDEFPIFPLHHIEGQIHALHRMLRSEIDKPRG